MPGWRRAGLVGAACAVLLACTAEQPPLAPEQTLALLAAGRPLLGCREPCLDAWRRAQPEAAALLVRGQWRDLALLVASVGYQDDLSVYYLGRAAQGLGNRNGAISYYRQSAELSGTSIGCAYLSRQCGGVSLPRTATARLEALLRPAPVAAAPRPAPRRSPATPVAVEPVPAAAPAPGRATAPADVGDFIEPPAASR